jgi:IclR family acetate operon transcriptional repressor
MQVAMKRNVIRRKAHRAEIHAANEPDARDGGVQSVDRALSSSKRWPKTMRDIG